jgi:hypothetical protein
MQYMCVIYGEMGRHSRRRRDLMHQYWRLALITECDRVSDWQTAVVPVFTLQLLWRLCGVSTAMLELVP